MWKIEKLNSQLNFEMAFSTRRHLWLSWMLSEKAHINYSWFWSILILNNFMFHSNDDEVKKNYNAKLAFIRLELCFYLVISSDKLV